MNRTKKYCSYRDCVANSQTHPERTFFQFPKDEERAQMWCVAGEIDVQLSPKYMCDLHFSHIYMCYSARRKMLLQTAIPIPYGTSGNLGEDEHNIPQDEEEIAVERLDEIMLEENEEEMNSEMVYVEDIKEREDERVEENEQDVAAKRRLSGSIKHTIQTKISRIEPVSSSSQSVLVDASKPITPPTGTILRKVKLKKISKVVKMPQLSTPVVTKNLVKVEPNVSTNKPPAVAIVSSSPEKKSVAAKQEIKAPEPTATVQVVTASVASSSSSTVPSSAKAEDDKSSRRSPTPPKNESIYEFIFKGEEYVQLPKATYYGEKKELEKRLQQCQSDNQLLARKLEYYRNLVGKLHEVLGDVCEEQAR